MTARSDLASDYLAVRTHTEQLTAPLGPEDQTVQSMPDVSPTKWHRAHTTWFFETFVLEEFDPDHRPFDPAYRYLFNSYYEGVGPQFRRADRGLLTRPGAAAVGEYRRQLDARMLDLLGGDLPDRAAELVELGLQHEQQHQELIVMDAKHVLSLNPLRPVYREESERPPTAYDPLRWLEVRPGIGGGGEAVEIGHAGPGFAFDNETPRHRVHLYPYAIADRLVTEGEWLGFVDDGGYERPELWLSDGWHTVRRDGWTAPLYWRRDGTGWVLHTLAGTRPIDPASPMAHVSFYEADAYARWAGARLPTEAEWEHAVATLAVEPTCPRDPHDLEPRPPAPSGSTADAVLRQVHGQCWQWTASAYLAYPGFRPPPGAVGEYNGKFMSGQMVLRGSSAYTPAGHARDTYRNFFPPHCRWMLAGVRLADGGHP